MFFFFYFRIVFVKKKIAEYFSGECCKLGTLIAASNQTRRLISLSSSPSKFSTATHANRLNDWIGFTRTSWVFCLLTVHRSNTLTSPKKPMFPTAFNEATTTFCLLLSAQSLKIFWQTIESSRPNELSNQTVENECWQWRSRQGITCSSRKNRLVFGSGSYSVCRTTRPMEPQLCQRPSNSDTRLYIFVQQTR